MRSLSDWLDSLGLGHYAQRFADHEVDLRSVRLLQEADLRELGLQLGPRKLLLRAIAQLNSAAVEPARTDSAERRQLTVLFCDLVGSTALSGALDPEDLRELMGRYQLAARGAVQRYQGHVAQLLGDGVVAYFGWPRSHGDDARRAVLTALDMVSEVRRLRPGDPLAVRIGIATGLVVIGQGQSDAVPPTAVGETPNLAARLQAIAEPNTIVVAALTRTLAGERFDYRDLGHHSFKGVSQPLQVYAVEGERALSDGGFGAEQAASLLVGREQEAAALHQAWQRAQLGHGQVVLLSGEPGIGKSALAAGLLAQLRSQEVPYATLRCSPFHAHSALYPMVEHLRRVIGTAPGEAPGQTLARLEAWLEQEGQPLVRFVPSLAALLELALPGERYEPLQLGGPALRRRINEDLVQLQLAAAERRPMVLVWEDLHWCDPSSLEYIGLLVEQMAGARLLIVLTSREQLDAPWTGQTHVHRTALSRLEPPQIMELMRHAARGKSLPGEVVEHIVAKADGIPLFAEELTRTIAGSGVLRETDAGFELAAPLAKSSIPATLHESLMARLDRDPCQREVAQVGSVLGREFSYEMLHSLALVDEEVLDAGLAQLVADEILYRKGEGSGTRFVFKHALIQDAAYESLLKRTRQQHHRRVAQWIEEQRPQTAEQQPELLAQHYAGAAMTAPAVGCWLRAIGRAIRRAAYAEAFAQTASASELLDVEPHSRDLPEWRRLRLKLQVALAHTLSATRGMGAAETRAAFVEAAAQGERLGEPCEEWFHALIGTANYHVACGEVDQALTISRETLRMALALGESGGLAVAHRSLGVNAYWNGQYREAEHHLRHALALYDPVRDHASAAATALMDGRITCLSFLGGISLLRGYLERGMKLLDEALMHAERLGHPYVLGLALVVRVHSISWLRDDVHALACGKRLLELCDRYGIVTWHDLGAGMIAAMYIDAGAVDQGLRMLELFRPGAPMARQRMLRGEIASAAAVALVRAGRLAEAAFWHGEALACIEAGVDRMSEPLVYMLQGDYLLARDGPEQALAAEAWLLKALETARALEAGWWQLRAANGLADLWISQGRRSEAMNLLAPIYDGFTEGFTTPGMVKARTLLGREV